MQKSGEGTRGGQIIGHTLSGHPIYAPGHAHYTNVPGVGESSKGSKIREFAAFTGPLKSRYKSFSATDHIEAARQHMAHADAAIHETDTHRAAAKPEAVNWHAVVAAHAKRLGHEHASLAHFAAAGHDNPYKAMEEARVQKSLSKSGKGEGSRGGKIIGHDQRGRPIYARSAAGKGGKAGPPAKQSASPKHDGAPAHVVASVNGKFAVPSHEAQDHLKQVYELNQGLAGDYAGDINEDDFDDEDDADMHFEQHIYPKIRAEHLADAAAMAKRHFPGWTPEDHAHAAKMYAKLSSKDPMSWEPGESNSDRAELHSDMAQGLERARDRLKKSGEGSRGGHIIGHTRSGAPVYANRNALHYGASFSANDHADAAAHHAEQARQADEQSSEASQKAVDAFHDEDWDKRKKFIAEVEAHHEMGIKHSESALSHRSASKLQSVTKSQGEGTRGGRIIGHTRSGKPVYQKQAAKNYSDFSPEDHDDARGIHLNRWGGHWSGMDNAAKQNDHKKTQGALALFESHQRDSLLHRNRAAGHEIAARKKRQSAVQKSEGSRGGHVIGHTRSGKPIYDTRHSANLAVVADAHRQNDHHGVILGSGVVRQAHLGFTRQDHLDAADLHASTAASTADHAERRDSHVLSQAHAVASMALKKPKDTDWSPSDGAALKKAEGERGGQIIGHTSSGHPVYASHENRSPGYDAHFTHDDHREAALMHETAATAHLAFGGDKTTASVHRLMARFHVNRMGVKKSATGDGSRGGHVIGHTKTGKPIYQASHGTTGRLSHLGVRAYSGGDHADAIAAHTALLSSGLPEEHAAGARRAIAYHQKKSGQAPSPAPPAGIQAAVAHPGTPLPASPQKAPAQNPTRALTSIAGRMDKLKTDDASIASGQYRRDKKAFDAHALKVHGQHFSHMTAEHHLAAAQDHAGLSSKSGADREKARVARTAHGAMAHALFARQRASARTTPPPATTVIHGLPPRAPAPQQTAKSTSAADLQDQDTVTVETPAETIKLVDRLVQNMRLAGLDVEVEGTSDGGYSIRRRLGGQPIEIRPDGAVRAPEALILFALGDDQALAKAGIAIPSLMAAPKPPAVPAAPKVAAPKPAGNAVLGKTSTGGTIWAQAKADSPVYRGFSPRDHAQAANMHQLAGNHEAAGAHRAMHAKLTAPKAPALPAAALAARPKMGAGRMAMSRERRPDMVKWESQELLGEWLGKAKGEGSRGGEVIGHTRGGKPIYYHHDMSYAKLHAHKARPNGLLHPNRAPVEAIDAHPEYSAQDHRDAAAAHEAKRADNEKLGGDGEPMLRVADAHRRAARRLYSAGLRLKKAGLMSMFSKPKLPAMPSVAPPHVATVHPPAAPGAPAAGGHGGEGSKGGQVVGHTQSGKPIYSSMHANNYKKFSMGEHSEASLVHGALSHAAHVAGNKDLASHHANMRLNHVRSMQRLSGSPTIATGFNTGAPVRQQRARRASLKKPAADAPAATQAEA